MNNNDCILTGVKLSDTGFGYTLSVIGGKYRMVILYVLYKKNIVRFNQLKRIIGTISYKTLSVTLKQLEADKLIIRTEYPQIPPKVEYKLSKRGETLIPVLDKMCRWGLDNKE